MLLGGLPARVTRPAARPAPAQEFLNRFAPHAGTLNPPEFPSNFLPKAAAPAEGAAAAAIPEKLQFNFFVPHETVCQSEKVRAALRVHPRRMSWARAARARTRSRGSSEPCSRPGLAADSYGVGGVLCLHHMPAVMRSRGASGLTSARAGW